MEAGQMELYQVEVTGFKKFKEKAVLKTRGKVLAILGANEAGKSSLLKAFQRLDDNGTFAPHEISRGGVSNKTTLKATYLISNEDRESVGLNSGLWYDVTKTSNGERSWAIRPKPADRDYSHRRRLVSQLAALGTKAKNLLAKQDEELFIDTESYFAHAFRDNHELSDDEKEGLSGIVSRWQSSGVGKLAQNLRKLHGELEVALMAEQAESLRLVAGRELWKRLPDFLLFSDDDRDLKSYYLWSELSAGIPTALENLAKVAELDMAKLIAIATTDPNDPEFDTIMERANAALEKNFQAAWNQSSVAVVLAAREQNLLVQVYNNDRQRTDFSQRSDGLRQFVALRCFTAARESDNFILLIDEAEQHLHYDAQADLVQMLASQTVAAKVIYTTHSVGCLPEDLGNGVRLVLPTALDSDWSKIENKFWNHGHEAEAAFSPILMGMGASTMAFFPTRCAVLVEGPSDTILLPTMFREALDRSTLGVQFVHGLSENGRLQLPLLNSSGKRVCYLLDHDDGGRILKKDLMDRIVGKDLVFLLPRSNGDCELEDFIDPALLAEAASQLARQHLNVEELIAQNSLPKFGKWDHVLERCKERNAVALSKVEFAYTVLELLESDPNRNILDSRLVKPLARIATSILEKLDQATPFISLGTVM